MSQEEAETSPPPTVPYAHISILAPGSRTKLPDSPHRVATLFQEYDDIREEHELPGGVLMSDEQAREVVLFVRNLPPQVEVLICQCRAGCSRSPATAAAIARMMGRDDRPYFTYSGYAPNRHVYDKILLAALIESGPRHP